MPKTLLGPHNAPQSGGERSVPYDRRGLAATGLVLGTWIVWTLLDIGYIWCYGVDIPFWDEWDATVPYLTGDKPCSWESLWASHNEHRLVIPKLAAIGLLWIGDGDFRTPMYVSAILLSAACGAILWSLRRRRGRFVATDVVVPLVLLPWIHSENLLWAFQLAFVLNAVLPCLMMASLIALRPHRPQTAYFVYGVCALTLPLTGAAGTVVSFFAAPVLWLPAQAAWSAGRWKQSLGWIAASLLVWGVCAAAFVPRQERHPGAPWSQIMVQTGIVATTILGDSPGAIRHWAGVGCAAAIGLAAWRLAAVARGRPGDRSLWLGLLAILIGLAAVCGAIAYGRTGVGGTLAKRYATLVAPLVVLVYVVAEQCLSGRARQAATWSLVVLFAGLQWDYVRGGRDVAAFQSSERNRFRDLLLTGVDVDMAVKANGMSLHPDPQVLQRGLRGLAAARIGYFEKINVDRPPQ
jgi:hypothetical protein